MQTKLPYSWTYSTLGECLIYEQPTKYIVKNTKYSNEYETPVLTAGKSFILGYTDDIENIFTQTPVIIFDDFTTDSKFVDFHFKVKLSAMKILHATEIANIKFVFYFMQTIQYRSDTHKRYWISEYAKLPIPLPPLETQQKIVAKLESEFAKIESAKSHLEKVKETIPRLKNSLLKSAFNGELTHQKMTDSISAIEIAPPNVESNTQIPNLAQNANVAQTPSFIQAPNLGGATLVAQNPQNGTNPLNCHLEHGEETHKESSCHSEALAEESQNIKPHKDSTLKDISATPQYDKTATTCHDLECNKREESHIVDSNRDISHFSNAQYDNVDSCHSESPLCHSDLECNEREESKSHFVNAQYEKHSNLPQDWEIKTLGEICETISAGGDKPNNATEIKTQENKIPIYANGISNDGLVGYTNIATILRPAVTVSARGTIGFACTRYEPYFPIVRLISAIPNESILKLEFLRYTLEFFIPKGEGSSIP